MTAEAIQEVYDFIEGIDYEIQSTAQKAWIDFFRKTESLPDHIVMSEKDYYETMHGIYSQIEREYFTPVCVRILNSPEIEDGTPFCFNYRNYTK